ncbi:YggU family protein [Candidatus Woesearchaeota archaeon]|nr:YggU family protein [Candidatus Woesearchaeota archaeon]
MRIVEGRIRVIIRPNSNKNEILGFDKEKGAYRVSIKAAPEKGKANAELVKFLSKLLKRKVTLVSGMKRKEKTLRIS